MTDNFSFDDPRPRSWLDAFPWLKGAAESATPWWNDPIDDADVIARQQRLAQISELAMERLTRWTIGQIFPGLSPDLELNQANLPTRAVNALGRHCIVRAGDLTGMTLESILEWRQVGVGTVDAILQALAEASTSSATPTVMTRPDVTPSVPPIQFDAMRLPEWMTALVDDLTTIATWYATVGLPGQPLLGGPLAPGTPDEVVKARQRIEELRPDDVLFAGELDMDIAGLFDDALRMLEPKALHILSDRLFGDEVVTLDEIGRAFGVSRERIRQIEGKARGAMLGYISDGSPLEMVAHTARTLIGTIRPLEDLLAVMPALGKTVESVGQPAWRVLDRLDDAYQIEDGWCVVPTMTAARTVTQTQLQEHADPYGVVRLEDLEIVETSQPERRSELTAAWLTHCGYLVDGDYVLTRTKSVGDYGAAVLSIAGSPLSVQEILDRFVVERSASSLRNAMSIDDRFERVDRDQWALKEWGLEAYAGIRSVIREQVARHGGRARLDELVEYITGRYAVAASSVTAYASTPPFTCKHGYVRLAAGDREIRKTPEQTRRMFRRRGAWAYRVRITTDHLRGSGSVAPVSVASILDLKYGETRQLASAMGPQSVAWTGIQPQFGTIRRFLMDGDIAAGTEAFLVIHDDGTFTFEVARDLTGNPLLDALSLIGAPETASIDEARGALTAAVGLPKASPVSSVIGAYRERGDGDIADLLTSIREVLETGHAPAQLTHRADVDEILDLL